MLWADDSGSCGDDVTYNYVESTKTLTISGTGAMSNFEYNTSNKSSNEPWQSYKYDIRHVVIENGVTTIGNYFLRECTELVSLTIPSSVTYVGLHAFNGCTGLTKVMIDGSGDIKFDSNSFRNCNSIRCYVPQGTLSGFLKIVKSYFYAIYETNGEEVVTETFQKVPNDFTTYYDCDGDGVIEYLSYKSDSENYESYHFGFYDKEGILKRDIDATSKDFNGKPYHKYYATPTNGKGDLMYFNEELSSDYYGRKSYDISDVVNIPSLNNVAGSLLMDVDNDGRKDLIGDYSYPDRSFTIYYQQEDGSFKAVEQSATLDAEAAAKEANKSGGGVVSFAVGMMVDGGSSSPYFNYLKGLDINEDGILDMLDMDQGGILYSYADNKFLANSKKGVLYPCDLNNDGEFDYICFDGSNIILMTRTGSATYDEKTLFTNSNVKQILYKDFDHDGDIDIMAYINDTGTTYFVFFRNDGDLSFKRRERNFAVNYDLLEVKDVDADGLYEMVVIDYTNKVNKILRISENLTVTETNQDFSDETFLNAYSRVVGYDRPIVIGDFDNDGKVDYRYIVGSGSVMGSKYGKFSDVVNSAPNKMEAPTAVLDAEAQRLRINWKQGTDKETSSCDLTYELRIGTEPASGNVLFGASLADGTRRTLEDGNMGRSLSTLFNAKGLKPGKYYISVQAVDAGGRGGAWSDDFVYEHQLAAPVIVSNYTQHMSTADTLRLSVKAPIAGATYQWTLSEGKILKSERLQAKRAAESNVRSVRSILWTADDVAQAGTLYGKTFENDGLKITILDTNGKMNIDANTAYFGTTETYQKYGYRLRSGGNSSDNLGITITLPSAGTLRLLARSGSNSAKDRPVTVKQNGSELLNQIVKEDDAVNVDVEGNSIKVYPIYATMVDAGTAEIGFPVGSINFYAIQLVTENSNGENGGENGNDNQPMPEGSYAQCIFEHDGKHTINLAMTYDGRTLNAESFEIEVEPAKRMSNSSCGYVDFNQDGYPEFLGFVNDGKGNLEKVLLSYATQYSGGDYTKILDFNMDGYPDVVYSSDKVLINLGEQDNDFDVTTEEINTENTSYRDLWFDANNDGYLDTPEGYNNGTNRAWMKYTSTDSKYAMSDNYGNVRNWDYSYQRYNLGSPNYDVNRDGMLDIVTRIGNPSSYEYNERWYVMYKDSTANMSYTAPQLMYETENTAYDWRIEDINNDGYADLLYFNNDTKLVVVKGSATLPYTEAVTYDVPRYPSYNDYKLNDYNNDGFIDIHYGNYGSISTNERDILIKFGPDFSVESMENPVYLGYEYDKYFMVQKDEGYPGGCDSHIQNQSPSAPATVAAKQTKDGMLITWSDAEDDHTPAMQMRYNVSVKRKGKKGDNSFVISPMNGLKDEATICGTVIYKKSTQMIVPASVLTAGETYEIQVQAIDLWNQHSPMTKAVEFTMTSNGYIDVAEQVATDKETTVKFVGAKASKYSLNAGDGATIISNNGNGEYIVKWATDGVKDITMTVGNSSVKSSITVVKPVDLAFSVPAKVFAGVPLTISVSDEMAKEAKNTGLRSSNKNVKIDYVTGSKTASVTFPATGKYTLEAYCTDEVRGGSCTKTVNVNAMMPTAEIEQVDVDGATGFYSINWDASALPSGISKVVVMKEGSSLGSFSEIATVDAGEGAYVDNSSNPRVMASRYSIRLLAENGQESEVSVPHRPLHVMIAKAAKGYNLIWDCYEGLEVESYSIMRGSTPENMQEIAKVAGSMKSYTDTKAPVGVSYYAVMFNISQAVSNSLNQMHVTAASNDEGVSSNIISTEDAVDVVAAQSIELIVLDENKSLSNSHKELQLYYMILPTYATIDKVAWEITEGSNIAKIDANGKLTATGGKGTVKVRVNTIDGSNLSDEISVSCTVSGGAPTDVEKPETVTEKTLVGKRYFTIDGKPISNPVAGEVFVEWSIFSDGQITAKKMMKK